MIKSIAENRWVRQIAVALGYALVYTMLRPYSASVWTVTAGLRLSCLLLFPYRYWPALIVGEGAAIVAFYYPLAERFGTLWVVVNSVPPMLTAAPIVWWCIEKLKLFPSRQTIKFKPLLVCIAALSLVWVAVVFASSLAAKASVLAVQQYQLLDIPYMFLGKYVGILTIVPLALAFKLRKQVSWRAQWTEWTKSRLALDTAMLLLPTLAVLVWMYRSASADMREIIHMAMFLPVAWLTSKHGWRAAAIGTTVTMFCIFIGMSDGTNLGLVETQAFIAFASTSLFALGVRISAQNALEEQERLDAQAAVKLAQQGFYACEVRMRQTAQALEQIGGTLQLTHTRLLNRFKHMLPLTEGQTYYKQAAATQTQVYRLAESMHPSAWRERGLPAAMSETIARSLDESGVAYRFQLKGRGLSQLSPGVHAAIYRIACEAVVYICEQHEWSTIVITLRGGFTNGQRWAALRVEGLTNPSDVNDPIYTKCDSRQLAAKLGTNGLGIDAMRDHVRLYDGDLHMRTPQDKVQITTLMHDDIPQLREATTGAPARELYIR